MTGPGLSSQADDEVWQRLAIEIARGAEYDSNERRPFSQCLPDTRVELLHTLETSLTQQDNKLVWLFGGSGSGKSSVACSTADRLRNRNQLAATFFFSRKDVSRSNTDRVFLTIAYQIGVLHHRAREAIVKAIRHEPDLLSLQKSRRDQFNKLVIEPLRELNSVWCMKRGMVFDAADEGETSHGHPIGDLVRMLAELLRDPTIPISSILCTSRTYSHLQALTRRQDVIGLVTPLHVESFSATEDIRLYLRHTFHEIYYLRDLRYVYPLPWPPEHTLSMLVDQIQGKFIVAATVGRLVHDASDPIDCLNIVSSMYRGDIHPLHLSLGSIDSVYHYIIANCDLQDRHLGVECLADIIALASPLSLSNICKLFATDIRKHVTHLSAIMLIPPMDSPSSVQIYHTSLRDYLSTGSRSGSFHVDPAESHRRLAGLYLELMGRELKRDICGLKDPSKLHTEIDDFDRKRDAAISGALRYACLYWPYHLEKSNPSSENKALVVRFLQERLLFFLEALSLMGCLDLAVSRLTDASRVVSMWESSHDRGITLELLSDAWRLTSQFFEPIRDSVLHLYESALSMCPLNTQIRRTYQEICTSSTVLVTHGLDDNWDSVLRTVEGSITHFKMSPSGDLLATVSDSRRIEIWNPITGLLVGSYHRKTFDIHGIAFSHTGLILACSLALGISFWEPHSNNTVDILIGQHPDFYSSDSVCAFAPSDLWCAYGMNPPTGIGREVNPRLYVFDKTGGSWSHQPPIHLTQVPSIADLAVSQTGLVMITSQEVWIRRTLGVCILDVKDHSVTRLIECSAWSCWHTFSHDAESIFHVRGRDLDEDGENCVGRTALKVDRGNTPSTILDVSNAESIRLPIEKDLHAFLLGDYIYSRDRTIRHLREYGNHFSAIATNSREVAVVDLSLLHTWSKRHHDFAHQQVANQRNVVLQLLGCQPDTKEAVVGKFGQEHAAIQGTVDTSTGWQVTYVSFTFSASTAGRTNICTSRDMSVLACLDEKACAFHLYGLDHGRWIRDIAFSDALWAVQNKPRALQFSPRCTYLCFADRPNLWIWLAVETSAKMSGLSEYGTFEAVENSNASVFSADETRLAVASSLGEINIYSLEDTISLITKFNTISTEAALPHSIPTLHRMTLTAQYSWNNLTSATYTLDILTSSTPRWQFSSRSPFSTIQTWRCILPEPGSNCGLVLSTSKELEVAGLRSFDTCVSPHMKRFQYNNSAKSASGLWPRVIDIKRPSTTDDPSTLGRTLLAVDDTCPPSAIVDTKTWSNVTIDGAWLRVGPRRICWLPERYRPVNKDLAVFANQVLFQIRETPWVSTGSKSMVLHIRGAAAESIHYYDW